MSAPTPAQVAVVRRFNRVYTARADLLNETHLDSEFSLAEARLLFELAHRDTATAAELCRHLRLDKGYVSRVLAGFRRRGFVSRRDSPADGRESRLVLTRRGRAAFAPLDRAAAARVRAMLTALPAPRRQRVVRALDVVASLVAPAPGSRTPNAATEPDGHARPAGHAPPGDHAHPGDHAGTPPPVVLRHPRPGDLGWVVQRHGALYADEYGYDERFEALVAGIVAEFVKHFDAARDRCWIAERAGEPVGSVFLVRLAGRVAKLRLLLVEPSARGAGVGRKLVHACTTFARRAGYRAIELWTQEELTAARRIYEAEGYRLVARTRHRMFGPPAVAETWRLDLQ